MSAPDNTAGGQALAINGGDPVPQTRPRAVYTPVESAMGIMDSARFEHIGRVATVMAKAGLLPETLTFEGPEGKRVALPYEVIQARAYLIANQADLWHADPMAVAQCTSLVYNRLMYEGKLVHGIISARLGVDLKYEFGVYNPRKRDIDPMPDNGLDPDNQSLGVRVSGTLPGEDEPRWIAGSVAMWHKGGKSPWGNPLNWPRQCRYMGAREWSRAHKPSLMLGIITDDEVDEYEMGRAVGQIAPAAPQMLHAGFEERREAQVIEGPKTPRKAAARKPEAPKPDPLAGDDIPAEGGARPQPDAPAEPEPGASSTSSTRETSQGGASADAPSPDGTATTASLCEEEMPDVVDLGYPAADEIYHLDGDAWDEPGQDGRRLTYKNGAPFSRARRKAGLRIYEDHAPTAEVTQPDHVDEQPADEEGLPPEFATYIGAIEAAKSWAEVKTAMSLFYKTPLFTGLPLAQQNKIRADTWDAVSEKGLKDLPDHATDVSAFRLWIEHQDDADAIRGTHRILEQEKVFADKDDAFKGVIRKAVADRLDRLGA